MFIKSSIVRNSLVRVAMIHLFEACETRSKFVEEDAKGAKMPSR